ncbi:MAG: hypothetical protein QXL73_04645 [Thermoplasmata archaeon]
MKVYWDTKIYIVAPAGVATGGPELLHQLGYHLRNDLNLDAYMFYQPSDHPNPVHREYRMYHVPYVDRVEDSKRNIIIVPEVVGLMKVMDAYTNIRKIIWWLSVDNFYISKFGKDSPFKSYFYILINSFAYRFFNKEIFNIPDIVMKHYKGYSLNDDKTVATADLHLAQSYYAMKNLKDQGFNNVEYLSDYINEKFLEEKINLDKKEDLIVYNPRKGYKFTSKLIKQLKDYNFKLKAIENMNREEVLETLKKAKVYIDFGNHPGKDRLPREAAMMGCCIIVGKKGSAKFNDVPIPAKFKLDTNETSTIIKSIIDCVENYNKNFQKFKDYRKKIKEEPLKFKKDLARIFKV